MAEYKLKISLPLEKRQILHRLIDKTFLSFATMADSVTVETARELSLQELELLTNRLLHEEIEETDEEKVLKEAEAVLMEQAIDAAKERLMAQGALKDPEIDTAALKERYRRQADDRRAI